MPAVDHELQDSTFVFYCDVLEIQKILNTRLGLNSSRPINGLLAKRILNWISPGLRLPGAPTNKAGTSSPMKIHRLKNAKNYQHG